MPICFFVDYRTQRIYHGESHLFLVFFLVFLFRIFPSNFLYCSAYFYGFGFDFTSSHDGTKHILSQFDLLPPGFRSSHQRLTKYLGTQDTRRRHSDPGTPSPPLFVLFISTNQSFIFGEGACIVGLLGVAASTGTFGYRILLIRAKRGG